MGSIYNRLTKFNVPNNFIVNKGKKNCNKFTNFNTLAITRVYMLMTKTWVDAQRVSL